MKSEKPLNFALLERFKTEITEKQPFIRRRKSSFIEPKKKSCYKAMKTIIKLPELCFELLPSDLGPNAFFLLSDHKVRLAGKNLTTMKR